MRENSILRKENEEYKIMYENVVSHASLLDNELEKKIQEVTLISDTDYLTKIYNRKKLYELMAVEIERKKRYGINLTVVMFDIDHFKTINDNFGHDNGDIVLLEVVRLVRAMIRKTDILGRWGGDEFIMLLPNTSMIVAKKLVARIKKKIQESFRNSVYQITCSFGITEFGAADTLKDFIIRADKALYNSKNSGRNAITALGTPQRTHKNNRRSHG